MSICLLFTFDLGVAHDGCKLFGRMWKFPDSGLPLTSHFLLLETLSFLSGFLLPTADCGSSPLSVPLIYFLPPTPFFCLKTAAFIWCLSLLSSHSLIQCISFMQHGYSTLSYSPYISSSVQSCESSNHFLVLFCFLFLSSPSLHLLLTFQLWSHGARILFCRPVSPSGMCCLYINITRGPIRTSLHKESSLNTNILLTGELWRKEEMISH